MDVSNYINAHMQFPHASTEERSQITDSWYIHSIIAYMEQLCAIHIRVYILRSCKLLVLQFAVLRKVIKTHLNLCSYQATIEQLKSSVYIVHHSYILLYNKAWTSMIGTGKISSQAWNCLTDINTVYVKISMNVVEVVHAFILVCNQVLYYTCMISI